jgi:tetratricopeptide (TPR) repeat protein
VGLVAPSLTESHSGARIALRCGVGIRDARTGTLRPEDGWNYAIAGDALLEPGRYDEAFDSFDKVMERRPDAGAYARVAYARELQGDLDGAVQLMQMSAEATSQDAALR